MKQRPCKCRGKNAEQDIFVLLPLRDREDIFGPNTSFSSNTLIYSIWWKWNGQNIINGWNSFCLTNWNTLNTNQPYVKLININGTFWNVSFILHGQKRAWLCWGTEMVREEFTGASRPRGIQSSTLELSFLKISDTFPQCEWTNSFQKWPLVLSLCYGTSWKVWKCPGKQRRETDSQVRL